MHHPPLVSCCFISFVKRISSTILFTYFLTNAVIGVKKNVLPRTLRVSVFMEQNGFGKLIHATHQNGIEEASSTMLRQLLPPNFYMVSWFLFPAHHTLPWMRLQILLPLFQWRIIFRSDFNGGLHVVFHYLLRLWGCHVASFGPLLGPSSWTKLSTTSLSIRSPLCSLTSQWLARSGSFVQKAIVLACLKNSFLDGHANWYDVSLVIFGLCSN